MKSKKKLLLMGVGVMGALAMGVGATSTFAWYQATASATAAQSESALKDIATVDPNFGAAAVKLPVVVTVTPSDNDDVTLATWLDCSEVASPSKFRVIDETPEGTTSSPDGLWSGWANGSTISSGVTYTKKDKNGSANLKLFKTYTIGIAIPANQFDENGDPGSLYAYIDDETGIKYTNTDIVNLLKGTYIDVKVEGQARSGPIASRAKFFGFNTTGVPASCSAAGTTALDSKANNGNSAYSSAGYQLDSTTATWTGYFGLYVEGSGVVDSTNPHGDFKVTVNAHGTAWDA